MEQMHLTPDTLLSNGTYRIVRFINQGGFGCTYEVEHVPTRQRMAMKEFFPRTLCNRQDTGCVSVGTQSQRGFVDKLRNKFLREARSLQKLSHPGIVRVSDVFEENDTAYFIMDYIDGSSLQDVIEKSGAMPEAEAVGCIRQVCDALKYVHGKNILHLDVKPANIMVNSQGRAVLIDFGVSKQYDEDGKANTSTMVGQSPGYAPIEQTSKQLQTFTPATDVYALGATLYALLTGDTPPESGKLAVGEAELSIPEGVSDGVRQAIEAAMRTPLRQRPQSISEFESLLDIGTDEDKTMINAGVLDALMAGAKERAPEVETDEEKQPKPEPAPAPIPTPAPAQDAKGGKKGMPSWLMYVIIIVLFGLIGAGISALVINYISKDEAPAEQVEQVVDSSDSVFDE